MTFPPMNHTFRRRRRSQIIASHSAQSEEGRFAFKFFFEIYFFAFFDLITNTYITFCAATALPNSLARRIRIDLLSLLFFASTQTVVIFFFFSNR